MMVDEVHAHGALAGVELWHGGPEREPLLARIPAGPASIPAGVDDPVQTRAMDKADIRELKRWHSRRLVARRGPGSTSSTSMRRTGI